MFVSSNSPTSDGSGCAILASEDFVKRHGLQAQAIEIMGQAMATDLPSAFGENSCIKMVINHYSYLYKLLFSHREV